jgi:hypothetical protein
MRPTRRLYIALCQRLLALGVVVVALVPASGVVSLDVVVDAPAGTVVPRQPLAPRVPLVAPEGRSTDNADRPAEQLAGYAEETTRESEVPTAPVDPVVREVPLTPRTAASDDAAADEAADEAAPDDPVPDEAADEDVTSDRVAAPKVDEASPTEVVSEPTAVTGLGTVGVTWDGAEQVPDDAITVQVRTEQDGVWSEWSDLTYHEEHGPDPDSEEAAHARPGTDGTVVGDVDNVQVKVEMNDGTLPDDLKLAVVDPGQAVATEEEPPAIDTSKLGSTEGGAQLETSDGAIALSAAEKKAATPGPLTTVTPKPMIYSRAQWGADERMRDGSPSYFEIHGGFVHHTVNANDYRRKDVPAIIRSIYAYHTRSRGWSDIGYNFLVDRFGRIWEGRYGGVDRAVVGAHTLNYNSYSFAMSAIGNYETAQPSQRMLEAYGALMAWKLSLHGVSAGSTIQRIGSKNFQAINGHRDAASTACPGKYLYAKLPVIRQLAAAAEADWSGRDLQRNLVGSPHPDLVVRRASDGAGLVFPVEPKPDGTYQLGKPVATGLGLKKASRVLLVGDWDRDGFNDIATQSRRGVLRVWRGDGTGRFAGRTPIRLGTGYQGLSMLAAVGDMTGDGYPDLLGQPAASGGMRIYPGNGTAGLQASYGAYGRVAGSQVVGVGRWDGDGAPDVLVRNGDLLTAWEGNGPGGLTGPMQGSLNVRDFDWIVGLGDVAAAGGTSDLLVKQAGRGKVWLLQTGPSGFAPRAVVARGMRGYDLVG